jgi:predicted RNase H-like nuclease (RuvC/YqgF family)
MGDTPNTDEQRLAEFSNKLDSFKPEGFDEEKFAAFKEAVIGFHNDEVKGLKINTAKMKEEKDILSNKLNTLQTTFTENESKMKTLEQQLADNQPEELKKAFENSRKEIEERYTKSLSELNKQISEKDERIKVLESGVLERDVLAEFNKAAADKQWLGGGREMAQAFITGKHGENFRRLKMPDGSETLVNNESLDMRQALNKFLDTEVGKNLLKSGLSGGGADGSTSTSGTGKKLTRAEYDALSPTEQMNFSIEGGEII